ncbi:MAG: YeeE/YedE family protein [Sinobacterium sp.]|nr:YeeE/YedE family protein [Sinobacterium sp.]
MKVFLSALLAGCLFGAGLSISGMTDTTKVIGFLDLFGDWDISLMFVMGFALVVTLPAFSWAKNKKKPLCGDAFEWPKPMKADAHLLIGAALFGIGWGLYGLCPGPAIASVTYGYIESIYFLIAMFVGMKLVDKLV